MSLSDIEQKKGIKKGELLDRAGSTELAANLFRITQTDEKLKKDGVQGDYRASQTHFMVGGKVRQTINEFNALLADLQDDWLNQRIERLNKNNPNPKLNNGNQRL